MPTIVVCQRFNHVRALLFLLPFYVNQTDVIPRRFLVASGANR